MKFTFKEIKETGTWASFRPEYHEIKVKGRVCGWISESKHQDAVYGYSVHFHVVDLTEKCGFKNIRVKKLFSNSKEAKEWVKANETLIEGSKFTLHFLEKEV